MRLYRILDEIKTRTTLRVLRVRHTEFPRKRIGIAAMKNVKIRHIRFYAKASQDRKCSRIKKEGLVLFGKRVEHVFVDHIAAGVVEP